MGNHEEIELALSSDTRFYPGLFATAASIAYFSDKTISLKFHILDGGISPILKKDLDDRLQALHPHVKTYWHPIDTACFESLPAWRNCGKMNWARLLLPQILIDSSWVLYLDTDFLCLSDVHELWKLRDENCALLGVTDDWSQIVSAESEWFKRHHLTFDAEKYICSGLLLMNLEKFRRERIDQLCLENAQRYNDELLSPDQSTINITFSARSDLKTIPRKWQTFSRSMTFQELMSKPFLHFAGDAPWVCFPVNRIFNDAAKLWFDAYARLRGVSAWKALNEFYSPWEIVSYRLLYLLFSRVNVLRQLLFFYFRRIGHPESVQIYSALLHRFTRPPIEILFRK